VAQGTAIIEDDEFGRIMKVGAISYMQTFHTRCWRQIENFGKEWNTCKYKICRNFFRWSTIDL